jgi:exodeoxyribonuclease VII small subunit
VPRKKAEFDFETALRELEQLVDKMENGNFGLEESLHQFERGVSLTRACQKALSEAEQKVRILMQDNDKQGLEPFTGDENEQK